MTKISNIQYIDIENPPENFHADIFFASPTFETRSRQIPSLLHEKATLKFGILEVRGDKRKVISNRRFLKNLGFAELIDSRDSPTETAVEKILANSLSTAKSQEQLSVLIDVSCFSRKTIASIIAQVIQFSHLHPVKLSLAYSLASYVPPGNVMATNREVAPAHPAFAGWTTSPGMHVASIVGLGYERDKAIGAVEYLQSSDWWLFEPDSPETEYRPQVEEHNKRIIAATPSGRRLIYDVLRPVDTLISLESLVAGLKKNFKPILLPFGPKIFFALSLLVSALHEETAVWTVSGEDNEPEIDRKPSAHVAGISLLIDSRQTSSNSE